MEKLFSFALHLSGWDPRTPEGGVGNLGAPRDEVLADMARVVGYLASAITFSSSAYRSFGSPLAVRAASAYVGACLQSAT
ncbi:hypothetical protein GCM10010344_61010 [Streptomyces bluensis]|nr:hypothetical protein GCM10010344_61010 [Streptomyces bluensis]